PNRMSVPYGPASRPQIARPGRGHGRPLGSRVMKALRRLTVRASIPESLSGLGALANNLRWTWHPPTRDLFASMDDELFRRVRDPLRMLTEMPAERLDELAHDQDFLARTRAVTENLQRYLTEPRWYQRRCA